MEILYIDYRMYGKKDVIQAFQLMGHNVKEVDYPLLFGEKSIQTEHAIFEELHNNSYDIVFTSNYYPMVSNLCNKFGVKYISWTYDSPRISLYDRSILNECNYAFTFDSDECRTLRNKGVNTVYYMPLAVNPERIAKINITERDKDLFSAEVGLVASLYNEEYNLYDRMAVKLNEYTKGYLEGTIQAQKNMFGGFILEDILKNKEILQSMYQAMPYQVQNSLASLEYVYANYFLSRKTATIQRLEYIRVISEQYGMKVYTPGDLSGIQNVTHMGTVDYETDMYKVFRLSKINLNITLPSIHTGIPLRAMDIMGTGGFLLTNYQDDFIGLFEPEEEFVYFTSLDDALYKIDFYLTHEDERRRIAKNGRRKMEQCFTYYNQVGQMLDICMESVR